MSESIDAQRLSLLLNELRLPTVKHVWPRFAERSDKEGWPAARFLMSIAEHELAERDRRRVERHLGEARLLPGKTLENFDFDAVPMISKAQVSALCAGDAWLDQGANLILIGPPGGGKSHLSSAIGLALLEKGWRVLFARTSDLVQRLQVARRELALEGAIQRLEHFLFGFAVDWFASRLPEGQGGGGDDEKCNQYYAFHWFPPFDRIQLLAIYFVCGRRIT